MYILLRSVSTFSIVVTKNHTHRARLFSLQVAYLLDEPIFFVYYDVNVNCIHSCILT